MRIVFNAKDVGLGNNGGSRTIIKCAETIQDLGHEVFIASDTNKYKWHKIKVRVLNEIPKCDVIVATGFGSVRTTLRSKARKKFYYIRGFEIWRTSKRKLFNSYKSLSCIVNSLWLKDYFHSKGIKSRLVYPGLDFEDFYSTSQRRDNIIGGIFSKKHKTKRHQDVIDIGKKTGYKVLLLNRDILNPSPDMLRAFYNKIKVWVSSSELEGLHNCPMEASLCGCGLVASSHQRGGTRDYSTHKKTSFIYNYKDINEASCRVNDLMNNDDMRCKLIKGMKKTLISVIGDRESNMKKMVKIFES